MGVSDEDFKRPLAPSKASHWYKMLHNNRQGKNEPLDLSATDICGLRRTMEAEAKSASNEADQNEQNVSPTPIEPLEENENSSSRPEQSSDEESSRKRKSGEHFHSERKRAKIRKEAEEASSSDESGSSSDNDEAADEDQPKESKSEKKTRKQKQKHLRRNIKNVLSKEQLDAGTKEAQAAEEERLRRIQDQRKQALQAEFLRQIQERRLKELRDLQAKQQEIIQLSSDLSSDSDVQLISDHEVEEVKAQAMARIQDEPGEEEDPNNSGMHVDDRLNVPNPDGHVLVNVGHEEGEQPIFLPPQLSRVIKPHQIGGIRFLYDNVIESQDRYSQSHGFGCILAHSMGLGKTIQLVSFCDIFLKATTGRHILCIVPINTIQNWISEFNQWLPTNAEQSKFNETGQVEERSFKVFALNDALKNLEQRRKIISEWQRDGGVLLMGYELYRQLANKKPRKARKSKKSKGPECIDLEEEDKTKVMLDDIQEALIDPGPDLVICDEGHRIKNSHASISQALKAIRTKRRIVLTGYPLQNNLMEYWCMVDFVRPNFLGTKTEFSNMFERPIQNGQCVDSTAKDARLMMHRAHVLHTQLKGFVQRRGHQVLQLSLPPKNEHVILLRLTDVQRRFYKRFIDDLIFNRSVSNPLKAFAVCCKIWNHPDVLHAYMMKLEQRGLLDDLDIELDEFNAAVQNAKNGKKPGGGALPPKKPVDFQTFNGGFNPFLAETKKEEINYDWAKTLMSSYESGLLENSAKFQVFFAILDETIKAGDRLLLFSQSLLTLNLIEDFLQQRTLPGPAQESWHPGHNYYRLDGSTPAQERERLINSFNANPDIPLFMVSTRAGSLGINLVGANRVVVLDASWNPCHDSQAVCRVYRYGQTKVSHIYRLVTDNSIERKIYDRQVNKQGMADRVVDEQNPDNHLSSKEISTLICENEADPPVRDFYEAAESFTDQVLKNLTQNHGHLMTRLPFTHESLLVDRKEKKLTKAEKRLAERSYALERTSKISYSRPSYAAFYPRSGMSASNLNQPGSNGLSRASYADQYQNGEVEASSSNGVPMPASKWFQRPVANVRPYQPNDYTYPGGSHSSVNPYLDLNSMAYSEASLKEPASLPYPEHSLDSAYPPLGMAQMSPKKPISRAWTAPPSPGPFNPLPSPGPMMMIPSHLHPSPRGSPSPPKRFPTEALAKQGVDMQELLVPKDMLIPTNTHGQPPIALKQGQKVMVIRTPKGIYLRMGEKIIKIRLPPGLLNIMVNGGASNHNNNEAVRASDQLPVGGCPATVSDVVTLTDSSSDEAGSNGIEANPARELFQMVASAGAGCPPPVVPIHPQGQPGT